MTVTTQPGGMSNSAMSGCKSSLTFGSAMRARAANPCSALCRYFVPARGSDTDAPLLCDQLSGPPGAAVSATQGGHCRRALIEPCGGRVVLNGVVVDLLADDAGDG